jgi:hypothetical protein
MYTHSCAIISRLQRSTSFSSSVRVQRSISQIWWTNIPSYLQQIIPYPSTRILTTSKYSCHFPVFCKELDLRLPKYWGGCYVFFSRMVTNLLFRTRQQRVRYKSIELYLPSVNLNHRKVTWWPLSWALRPMLRRFLSLWIVIVSHEGCPFKFQDWNTNAKVIKLTHVMVTIPLQLFMTRHSYLQKKKTAQEIILKKSQSYMYGIFSGDHLFVMITYIKYCNISS